MGYGMISKGNRGFTFLELSIGMAIVGILASTVVMPLAGRSMARDRYLQTQRVLDEAKSALMGFAIQHGRLPRPAISAVDGNESAVCIGQSGKCQGFLPWVLLSGPRSDAYSQLVLYSVTESLTSGIDKVSTGNLQISTRTPEGEEVELTHTAAAVIASVGKENWGFRLDGEERADMSQSNADEDVNASGEKFFQRSPSDLKGAPGGEFDDVVVYLSPEMLIEKLFGK